MHVKYVRTHVRNKSGKHTWNLWNTWICETCETREIAEYSKINEKFGKFREISETWWRNKPWSRSHWIIRELSEKFVRHTCVTLRNSRTAWEISEKHTWDVYLRGTQCADEKCVRTFRLPQKFQTRRIAGDAASQSRLDPTKNKCWGHSWRGLLKSVLWDGKSFPSINIEHFNNLEPMVRIWGGVAGGGSMWKDVSRVFVQMFQEMETRLTWRECELHSYMDEVLRIFSGIWFRQESPWSLDSIHIRGGLWNTVLISSSFLFWV